MYTTVETNAATEEVSIYEWTQEEIDARQSRLTPLMWDTLRGERNSRLANSDIYVGMDRWEAYTEPKKQEWRDYRQALRDLPQNTTDPFNPVWPVAPT